MMNALSVKCGHLFHYKKGQQLHPPDTMTGRPPWRPTILDWLAPAPAGTISVAFGMLCVMLVPSSTYERLIGESFLLVGHRTILWAFVMLCLIAFAMGAGFVLLSRRLLCRPTRSNKSAVPTPGNDKTIWRSGAFGNIKLLTKATLVVSILLEAVFAVSLVSAVDISAYVGSAGMPVLGSIFRMQLQEEISRLSMNWLLPATMILNCWAMVSMLSNSAKLSWSVRVRALLVVSLVLFCVCCLLTYTRGLLFFQVLILLAAAAAFPLGSHAHVHGRVRAQTVAQKRRKWSVVVFATLLLILVFIVIGRLRGEQSAETSGGVSLIRSMIGYFVSPYNRLAALLEGYLREPNTGSGFYSFQWLWDFPLVGKKLGFFSLGRKFGLDLPLSTYDNWLEQFAAVGSAGLNPSYNVSTAFGFAFADFGWKAPIWFILYGMVSGWAYVGFRARIPECVVLYSYFLITVAGWGGTIMVAHANIVIVVAVLLALRIARWLVKQ